MIIIIIITITITIIIMTFRSFQPYNYNQV